MDISILEQKYSRAPISWAIFDIIEEFIAAKKGKIVFVTLEEIREKLIECEFEPGMPELHRILAETDSDFVRYVFENAKDELESEGFTFTHFDCKGWKISKPKNKA